ncbi:fluoride efflux transporter CrcB [Blastochloris sulfoviridis]|uniref:Fluoride-specific ion channel FluC n=1 Tax=Blastochloris sulfoviridis TaxID=50712 RepID=A0A5M6HZ77_9HYPH|nr:fluoride efflux transporter CrcB [Blastochloris sulfoviridis]KAA5601226.1 fluoride efflux transporter CrcB [Blastochloris sulfoviridis]
MEWVLVAVGGALGSVARYWCSGVAARLVGESFPWGTLVVNVVGSFAIGLIAAFALPEGRLYLPASVRLFLMFGICGGFTTFSSFSLQTLNLLREGEFLWAGTYIGLSVVLCLAATWAGLALGLLATR